MANTINRITGNGDRSAAEGIPRSANGGTRDAASIGASRTSQESKQDASLNTANPQSQGGDEVQITNTAAKLAALGQSLSASSPVDDARVARISQALADGSYRVSAQQIATGLMQSDHALEQIGL